MLSFSCKNHKHLFHVSSGYCSSNNFRLTKIFDFLKLSLKTNRCEVLVLNALLKLFSNPQDMNSFKVWLRFPYHSICKKRRFDTHNIIKV